MLVMTTHRSIGPVLLDREMTTNTRLQTELAAEIAAGWRRVRERAIAMTTGLAERELFWLPPDGGWSIARLFEHLVIAQTLYRDAIRARLERAPVPGTEGAVWRPSLMGRLLVASMEPGQPRRRRAPAKLVPLEVRADVVDRFQQSVVDLSELVQRSERVDWKRTRLSSPVRKVVRLNLGDAHLVPLVHAMRHLDQVRRRRLEAGFPRA